MAYAIDTNNFLKYVIKLFKIQNKDNIITKNFFLSNIFIYKAQIQQIQKIQQILNKEGTNTNFIKENSDGIIILKTTSFLFETCGQFSSDVGYIYNNLGKFKVYNVIKHKSLFFHVGKLLKGYFINTNYVQLYIDKIVRYNLSVDHSAIHLLYITLQRVINKKIITKGFVSYKKKITFDFKSYKTCSNNKLFIIEQLINSAITKQHIIFIKHFSKQKHYIQHKNVNVVFIGNEGCYSIDVCNGTHIKNTRNIVFFCIVSYQNLSKGLRRIEALTNKNAIHYTLKNKLLLTNISLSFGSNIGVNNIKHLINKKKVFIDEFNYFKQITIKQFIKTLISKMFYLFEYKILIKKIKSMHQKDLFVILHNLVTKLVNKSIIIFYVFHKTYINVFIKITTDCLKQLPFSFFFKQLFKTNQTIFYNVNTDVSYLKTSINNFSMLYTKTLKTNLKTFLIKRG